MPEHPLLAVYVLGAYGWLFWVVAGVILRPHAFEALVRESGLSRQTLTALLLVAYSVLWPVMACTILAQIIHERRGGDDG